MSDKGWEGFGSAVGSVISERLASPLVGTFAISWSLWNFKFFVILFSKNSVTDTYAIIQTQCFPNWYMSFFNGLVAPLTLTMAYFYLLPVLSKIIFEEWSRTQKETKDIKQRWEDQNLLGFAEGQELRKKLRLEQGKLEDLETEIRKLKAELRQSDLRSSESQEALRVSDLERGKSLELMAGITAQVDAARNDAGSLKEALAEAKSETEQARIRVDLLKKELDGEGRPKKLRKDTEAALLVVAEGKTNPIAYMTSRIDQIAELKNLNFIYNTSDGEGRTEAFPTALGINYLVRHGLLSVSQLEQVMLNYGSKPNDQVLVGKHVNALANTNWSHTVSPEGVNKLMATQPDRQTVAAAISTLAGTKKLTKSEIEALITKLGKS